MSPSLRGEIFARSLLKPITPPISDRHPSLGENSESKQVQLKRQDSLAVRPLSTLPRIEMEGLGITFFGTPKIAVEAERESYKGDLFESRKEEVEVASSPLGSEDLVETLAPLQSAGETPDPSEKPSPNFNNFEGLQPRSRPISQPSLIEQLLEENYRAQAETFVRQSSQASIKSLSLTRTSSRSSSIRSNGPADISTPNKTFLTPARSCSENITSISHSYSQRSLRTPSGANRVIVEPFKVRSGSVRQRTHHRNRKSGFSPESLPAPQSTYGHLVYSVPRHPALPNNTPNIRKRSERSASHDRGLFFFTEAEQDAIAELVHAQPTNCQRHANCTDCLNLEYAYLENKAMPTSMAPEERQKIINNNRSLRNIKNELENLAESGAISDAAYDAIMQSLPIESSLNGAAPSRSAAASPTPVAPIASFSNLSVNDAPPAYPNAPSLPRRNAPAETEISRATALYRYAEPGDCNFEVGDQISVLKYMNADWWMGKNIRTGQEGVFPVNYVQVQSNPDSSPAPPQAGYYGNEKQIYGYGGYQPQQSQGPPPPGPSNPYNSAIPPMQIVEQPTEGKPGKGQEMGKKFGKKLGNAAIFGAGATIGGNIVNSIF